MTTPLATIDQTEQIAAALSRLGINGHGVSAYCEGAVSRAPATLTATEAEQILVILRGQVTQ
ncbi:MAG: hypothetical protein WAV54_00790 [Acidimicrobiales bacterium]